MSDDVTASGSGSGEEAETAPSVAPSEHAEARTRKRTPRWAFGVAAVVLAVGAAVAWNARYGDGTGTVLVTAEDPSAPEGAAPQTSGESDPTVGGATSAGTPDSGSIAGAGTDEQSTGAETDESTQPQASEPEASEPEAQEPEASEPETQEPEASEAGTQEPEAQPSAAPTPEALSTGPVLEWTEIDPGIDSHSIFQSVGDGRVLARAWSLAGASADDGEQLYPTPRILVTSNGTDWTEVPVPEGVNPYQVEIAGDRWLVAGPGTGSESIGYVAPVSLPSSRVYFSDDEGTTWTELDIDLPADPMPSSPWVVERSAVASALVSGERIVLAVVNYTTLDVEALLTDRGLLPDGKRAGFWLATPGDRLEITLFDAPDPDGPSTSPMLADEETLVVGIEELGLTDEEVAALDGFESSRVSVLSSDGSTVELVAQYDGLVATGVSTGDGFELAIFAERDLLVLSSADGLVWSEELVSRDAYPVRTVVAGGTIWRMVSDPFEGFSVQRGDDGQAPATVATFAGLAPAGELAAGPAGVVATAFPADQDGYASGSGVPEGRVAKDGYELRYNEPEGGVTLWDLTADAPVYEFGPEVVASDTTPDGVREIDDNGSFAVVFEDPETGADLVTFTEDDLNFIFESSMPDGGMYDPPELWVGWSADGTRWGWETLADAFGIDEDEGEPWAQVGVGRDFAIAQVQVVPRPDVVETAAGESGVSGSTTIGAQPPRWFIAQVP